MKPDVVSKAFVLKYFCIATTQVHKIPVPNFFRRRNHSLYPLNPSCFIDTFEGVTSDIVFVGFTLFKDVMCEFKIGNQTSINEQS